MNVFLLQLILLLVASSSTVAFVKASLNRPKVPWECEDEGKAALATSDVLGAATIGCPTIR